MLSAPPPGRAPGAFDATLALLAGGRGARMGVPKALLRVGEVTLVEWIVARLAPSFAEVLVAGAADAPPPARAVPDRRAGQGSLAGIEAALAAASRDRVFVLACDTPRVSVRVAAALFARLAPHDAAVPRVAGLAQPTCAAYDRRALAALSAFLDGGGRRALRALETLDVAYVDEEELVREGIATSELADLDTRADYDAFLASLVAGQSR